MKGNRSLNKMLPMLVIGVFLAVALAASATSQNVAWALTMTKETCQRCHGVNSADIVDWHHQVRNAKNWSCTLCHKTVSDGLGGYTLEIQRDCTVCHTPGYHTEPAGTNPNRHHAIRNAQDYGCMHCHPVVQNDMGDFEVVVTRDCFFCHTDGDRPWRTINHLTNLPTPTSPDNTATTTDITSKFRDTLMYDYNEIANTATVDSAITVRFDKDAATTSKVTLGFYVFELPNTTGTIRIYPYLLDGVTVDASTYLDFPVSVTGWAQCDVTTLAMKMSGFSWMKFRVTAVDKPIRISEGSFQIIKPDTIGNNKIPIAEAGSDQIVYLNTTVNMSGNLSYDPDGSIVSYDWDFGDGTIGKGRDVSHVYTTAGAYLVGLTITDNFGAKAQDFAFINVKHPSLPPNVAPVADAGPNLKIEAGQTLNFSGAASYDTDGQIYSWAWSFHDGTSASGETVSKIYTSVGTFEATLTVTDNRGAIATDSAIVTVTAPKPVTQPPTADAGPDFYAEVGTTVTFSGALSSDPDGTISSYRWDFGDGTNDTGITPTTTYTTPGIYVATLTVTDNDGAQATDTVTVTIHDVIKQNQPPVANAGVDVSTTTDQAITFSGAASTDADGTIASYSWNFGDGTTATGMTVAKTFTSAGTFTVVLTVTDNDGSTGTNAITAAITATNVPPVANAGPDATAITGQAVTFSGAGSSDSDGTIASYAWTFGDGTSGTGVSATKSYTTAGSYTVTLTVTDNAGAKTSDTAIVTVAANKPPVANAGPDFTATVNKAVTFSGAASFDPDGTIASYSWNFGSGSNGTGVAPSKTFTSTGTYNVTLTVKDNLGASATDTVVVTVVSNQSPVANAGPDVTAATGQTLTFSGAGSSDPDGTISSYSWNFGDGSSTRTGATVTKSYSSTGTYTVTLTVTDNGGRTATDTARITVVANKPPVANAGPDVSAATGQSVTFSGAASSDPDGTISSYAWNFGDGTSGTGVAPTKTYNTVGTYTVTLTVTDNAGAKSTDTAVVTVTSGNKPPVANAGADVAATTGQTITLSGSGSSDPDGTIASYAWTFGDGTSGTGVSATKSYATAGTYTVTLIVTDNAGATATDTAIVTVTATTANKPPVANAGADVSATTGQTITLSGSGSSDPDGTIASYAWTFGDGTSGTGVSATKSYATAGIYTVTLTVTDNAGATATDTAIITVTAVTSTYVSADQAQQLSNLSSRTSNDPSSPTDITAKMRDNVLTDTYRVDSSNAVSMKVNRDSNTTTQVILRVYVSSISGSQTLRIYPYQSNGTSLNTSSSGYIEKSVSGTGWKEIDVTAAASKMRGFGWMKFRITNSNSTRVAEGNFTIR